MGIRLQSHGSIKTINLLQTRTSDILYPGKPACLAQLVLHLGRQIDTTGTIALVPYHHSYKR